MPDLFDYGGGGERESYALAAAVIRLYCGWHVAPVVTEEMVLDGSGAVVQLLPSLKVIDLVDVLNDGEPVAPRWSEAGWMRHRGLWTCNPRGIKVTITHGYDECPVEIIAVTRRLARQGAGALGGAGGAVRVGNLSASLTAEEAAGTIGMDQYSAAILDAYRIVQNSV